MCEHVVRALTWISISVIHTCQWTTGKLTAISIVETNISVLVATDDDAFNMAVEILEFTTLLQNNELSKQWAWLCKSYQQQHAVALILSEICARPISPETNHAWDLVKSIYDGWQQEKRATNSQLEEPLSLLMERASISMMEKFNALGL